MLMQGRKPWMAVVTALKGRSSHARLAVLAVTLALTGNALQADTLLTGFGGVAVGGATDRTRGSYGAALGFLGSGPFGFEIEFGTTPEFFGNAREDVFTDNNVLTLMGSLLVASPAGPVRVYGAAGAGLMKTRLANPDLLFEIDSNEFGIAVGGGLWVSMGGPVSLRADVRYFRDLSDADPDGSFDFDLGNVDYWRVVAGITLRF